MPRPDRPPMTRGVVLRGIGLAVAIGLGAVGLWLIVTSTAQKRTELGALAEFWALLIGAFALFGSRRLAHPLDEVPPVQVTAQPGSAVELRSRVSELERAEDQANRREHEERLERMLRREIHASVAREVSTLRSEIAQLRIELLEKVGGQLRLEHIETTRVIGSDLEALHDEVRQLKYAAAQDASEFPATRARTTDTVRHIVEPARVRPVSRQTAEVEADVQPARQRVEPEVAPRREPVSPRPAVFSSSERTMPIRMPEPPAVATPTPAAAAAPPPAAPPTPPPAAAPTPPPAAPTPPPAAAPSPPPAAAPTPPPAAPTPPPAAAPPASPVPHTAGIPNIEIVPTPRVTAEPSVPPTPAPTQAPTPPAPSAPARPNPPAPVEPAAEARPAQAPSVDDFASLPRLRPFTDFELDPIEDEPKYTGRRRRGEALEAAGGRHSRSAEEEPSGRRRAPEEGGDELLAKLLARESARR